MLPFLLADIIVGRSVEKSNTAAEKILPDKAGDIPYSAVDVSLPSNLAFIIPESV